MAVTRLKRKGKRNKVVAKGKVARIGRLSATPVLKNVDVEAIKEEFAKKATSKAKATKKETEEVKAEAPVVEEKEVKKAAPKAKAKKEETKEEKTTAKKTKAPKAEAKEEKPKAKKTTKKEE